MSYSYEDVMLAVKRGAYWLDENHPGWEYRLNLSKLEMNDCEQCVIGQAVGNYYETLDGVAECSWNMAEWSIGHGFDVPCPDWDNMDFEDGMEVEFENYSRLEQGWTTFVNERLGR